MILRTIEVQGWRCLANACRLGPFGDGLNIVHAPNATGKSTVFEALLRGFFDGHRVSGEAAERIRSWGREVTPTVAIEFGHGGVEYRLVKKFLADRSAELLRKEAGRFVPLATGQAADTQARAILAGEAPGAGISKEKHWGLAQVLWAPQGVRPWKELTGDLLGSIRTSLGLQAVDSVSGSLEQTIKERFEEVFTPTGSLRGGARAPQWIAWERELEALRGKHAVHTRDLEEFDTLSRRIEDRRAQREHVAREENAAAEALAKATEERRIYATLVAEKQRFDAEAKRFEAEHHAGESRLAQIAERKREAASRQAEIANAQGQLPAHRQQAEVCAAAEEDARADLQQAREMHSALELQREKVEQAERFTQSRAEAGRLERARAEVERFASRLEELRTELARLIAPDGKTLRAIRAAGAQRADAQAQLTASMITLEIRAEQAGTLDVLFAEKTGPRPLAAGEPAEIHGAPEVIVRLPGVAVIKARGPVGSIEDLRAKAQQAARRVEELTRPFGTDDLVRLDELSELRSEREKEVATAEARLSTQLGQGTRESLIQELERHRATLTHLGQLHRTWAAEPPDAAALRADWQRQRTAAPAVAQLEARRLEAHTRAVRTQQLVLATAKEIESAQTQMQSLHRQLDALTGDGKDDAARVVELRETALRWSAARAALDGAQAKLAAFSHNPEQLAATLDQRIADLRRQSQQLLTEEANALGRLQKLEEAAPYSALAQAEEGIARLASDIARERGKADALRLLHETVTACRADVLARMTAPVETRALQVLTRVGGRHLASLCFDEKLALSGITPASHSAGGNVDPDNLSGGEQEQVHLAVRLALAQVLAADERQLVVLDDILMATDSGRLARMLSVFEELAQTQLQIIILTCHPERYYGLNSGTQFFDLEKIKLG